MEKPVIYSCKRKKDYVTLAALTMLVAIVIFELYLILILPIQLRARSVMQNNLARQRMVSLADQVRYAVYMFTEKKVSDPLKAGEITLVLTSLDRLAYYIRANQQFLSGKQISTLQETFIRFNNITDNWKIDKFHIYYKEFNAAPALQKIENDLTEQSKARNKTL